jgi:hypothetical protein
LPILVWHRVVAVGAIVASCSCQNASAKRDELPPPAGEQANGVSFGGSIEDEILADGDFKRTFGLSDLALSSCLEPGSDGTLVAKGCGAGAVLFGPYARAPRHSNVIVTLKIEGIKGTTMLAADVVSNGGARMHGWVSQVAIPAGAKEVIEFGASMAAPATDFETRLWSQSKDPSVVFRILSASIETRGP